MTSLSPENVDGSEFIGLFLKMFNETKYNLQALNKRIESMEKCINNVLLLNSKEPFDEEEENDLDISPEEMQLIAENYLGKDESKVKQRTPKKNKKKVINKSSSPVDSNSPGDIINSKVNPEKKVMKYSEFLKMKQKKKAEKLNENNKLEKRIEELSYKGNSLFNSNNEDNNNNKDNDNDNESSVPMINLDNY